MAKANYTTGMESYKKKKKKKYQPTYFRECQKIFSFLNITQTWIHFHLALHLNATWLLQV